MAKKKKRKSTKTRSGCRKVTFRKNKKGRRLATPVVVTLCPRDAKAKKKAIGRRLAKDACRRKDHGDKNIRTKHLFTRCRAL